MKRIRTYHDLEGEGGSEVVDQVVAQRRRLAERLAEVRCLVAVASGKGGVGKSAVTANLAAALARRGRRVGALDADLNGPSLARMLGVSGARIGDSGEGAVPPEGPAGVRVMSMELLQDEEDAPLSWTGPDADRYLWQSSLETGVLREFLSDVSWGDLDYLLVDLPPGTDKIARLLELVPSPDLFLLVTTPSEMSRFVVSKSVRMVRRAEPRAIGLVANMTEFVCPDCGSRTPLFPGEGDGALAETSGLEIWGRIPFDPRLGGATDRGSPLPSGAAGTPAFRALEELADRVEERSGAAGGDSPAPRARDEGGDR